MQVSIVPKELLIFDICNINSYVWESLDFAHFKGCLMVSSPHGFFFFFHSLSVFTAVLARC